MGGVCAAGMVSQEPPPHRRAHITGDLCGTPVETGRDSGTSAKANGAAAPQPGLTGVGDPRHPPHIGEQPQDGAVHVGQKVLVICGESGHG